MKKIVVLVAHPNKDSFCSALAASYAEGSIAKGNEVKLIHLGELEYNPNLRYGYQKRMDLEPDLLTALELIQWADHLVWIYPVWWYGLPAIAKGFIDRLFLPGIAFALQPNGVDTAGLFSPKTAQFITTLDHDEKYYKEICLAPSEHQLTLSLQLCGIEVIQVQYIELINTITEQQRGLWIEKVRNL
ncbi:NAD(P)H-dependent oxidoreductase [Myroides sp. mNGS23_01]|nr:NAD(P)H-dependent oxidoreductase [Myroides sp. mNGS23_01]WHT39594.1 NAD(P)H-dependent oxidoreductase [Myroides sp. mNGS23_01]